MTLYGKLYFSLMYPFYESKLRRRKTFEYYQYLQKSQWYERDQLLEIQFGEIKALLQHAYQNVPFYRKTFDQIGVTPDDIRNHDDYAKLPIIDKDIIRENKDDMVARNYLGQTLSKSTGGSTGQPLQFEYTRNSYEWRTATRMRGYEWAGCREGEKVGFIWGAPIWEPPFIHRVKEKIHHTLLRQKYFNSFFFNGKTIEDACRELKKFAPDVIVAYATPMYNFAVSVRDRGLDPPRFQSVITAAEKVQDHQRVVIEEVFGCKVFNTYGSREFMLIASECGQHGDLHVNVENLCVEIVHDNKNLDPSGPGELVVTDLHNFGMPFIRYKIGDLGIPSTNADCGCGRGLPTIRDVEGRLLDTIVTPDGRLVPGEFFPHLAKEFDEIKQFQVIQDDTKRLVIKIVPAGEFAKPRLEQFKGEVAKIIGEDVTVETQLVDEIPLTATGKFRVTISNVWQKNRA